MVFIAHTTLPVQYFRITQLLCTLVLNLRFSITVTQTQARHGDENSDVD